MLPVPHKVREIDASGQETPPRGFYQDEAGGPSGRKYYRAGGHEDFVDMGGIFSEMFGDRRGFGFGGASGGNGFDMGGLPVSYSLTVDRKSTRLNSSH